MFAFATNFPIVNNYGIPKTQTSLKICGLGHKTIGFIPYSWRYTAKLLQAQNFYTQYIGTGITIITRLIYMVLIMVWISLADMLYNFRITQPKPNSMQQKL